MKISYQMNRRLFNYRSQLFELSITARAYAEGKVAAEEVTKPVSEMQCF